MLNLHIRGLAVAWSLGIGSLLLAAQAEAAEPRDMVPAGRAGTELQLIMTSLTAAGSRSMSDYEPIKVGDKVQVCFLASQSGYITLWSHDAEGGVARVLPNQYTEGGTARAAVPISGGERHCISDAGLSVEGQEGGEPRKWWFEVREPLGQADLYLHWTADESQQLPDDSFVDIDELSRAVGRNANGDFVSTWFSYNVEPR